MKLTFWKLLNDNKIKIPLIQRDYAQGRENDKEIRERFLSRILQAFSGEPLNMDFIYGKIENSVFFPLDGQQRLTTLFLLHWYFAFKDLDKYDSDIFGNFSYETRISSEKFCKRLTKFVEHVNLAGKENELSKLIINQSWFISSWKNDPTVSAMLVMLDAINVKFHEINNGFERLTTLEDPIITFDYIQLEDFNLDDDLYIKMNARGKILNIFELFKSELDKKVKELAFENSLIYDMDGKYLDFFFDIDTSENKKNYENYFLNFIVKSLSFFYFLNEKDDKFFPNGTYVPFKRNFKDYIEIITPNLINQLISVLNVLGTSAELANLQKIFFDNTCTKEKDFILKISMDCNLNYISHLRFYAYIGFIEKYGNTNTVALENWMRIISNVTQNTEYDKKESFISALKIIIDLLPFAENIEIHLSKSTSFNYSYNWEEEWMKCKLLTLASPNGYNWREILLNAERNDKFLNGQIKFLLLFAGFDDIDLNISEDEKVFHDNFVRYLEITSVIFGKNPSGLFYQDNFGKLFRRALICFGDYFTNKGKYFTLLYDSDHRDYGFRRMFRDSKRAKFLKSLYDKVIANTISYDEINLTRILTEIIKKNTLTGFRKQLAEYEKLTKVMGRYYLFHNDDSHDYESWLPPCILTGGARTAPWYEFNTLSLNEELLRMTLCVNASIDPVEAKAGDYTSSKFHVMDTNGFKHTIEYSFDKNEINKIKHKFNHSFNKNEMYKVNDDIFLTKNEIIDKLKTLKVLL